jgi:DivIVA domain-containing protein
MNDIRRDPEATIEAAVVDPGYALAERVRAASFRVARRGYDRDEVDAFLAWLADELRSAEVGGAGADVDPDAVRRELERVGESTAAILRAAEQTARELRGAAKRDADSQLSSAREEAESVRTQAEEFASATREEAAEAARAARLESEQRATESVREAEERAESIIGDAIERRRVLTARVDELAERRDAILAEVTRLGDELRAIGEAEAAAAPPEAELVEGDEVAAALEEADEEAADLEEQAEPALDEGEDEEEAPAPPTLLVDPEPETEDGDEAILQPGISDEATQEFATYRDAESEPDSERR